MPFDPAKDAANFRKHGVSLARASDMDIRVVVPDNRIEYGEPRFRAFGTLDGESFCLVFTVRDGEARSISFRRAHLKEYKRYVP